MNDVDLHSLAEECRAFISSRQSLMLASLVNDADPVSWPDASYAPFVWHEGKFYIFVSELAAHTQNLLSCPRASVLFIEDEAGNRNPFARQRSVFKCQVKLQDRTGENYETVLDALQARFGGTVEVLRGLSDFRLFALEPEQGRYIVGFGKAYDIQPETFELQHVGPDQLKP